MRMYLYYFLIAIKLAAAHERRGSGTLANEAMAAVSGRRSRSPSPDRRSKKDAPPYHTHMFEETINPYNEHEFEETLASAIPAPHVTKGRQVLNSIGQRFSRIFKKESPPTEIIKRVVLQPPDNPIDTINGKTKKQDCRVAKNLPHRGNIALTFSIDEHGQPQCEVAKDQKREESVGALSIYVYGKNTEQGAKVEDESLLLGDLEQGVVRECSRYVRLDVKGTGGVSFHVQFPRPVTMAANPYISFLTVTDAAPDGEDRKAFIAIPVSSQSWRKIIAVSRVIKPSGVYLKTEFKVEQTDEEGNTYKMVISDGAFNKPKEVMTDSRESLPMSFEYK